MLMAGPKQPTEPRESNGSVNLRPVLFAPIAGDGLVQQTIRRLTDAINIGLLKDGERLPPESELSRLLGISAMTLRDALATMRNAGYIQTQRGRSGGNFITSPTHPSGASAAGAPGSVDLEYLVDLIDYRRAVTAEAAAL